jgi:hypothetical protein
MLDMIYERVLIKRKVGNMCDERRRSVEREEKLGSQR